jgi:hypothetical protein
MCDETKEMETSTTLPECVISIIDGYIIPNDECLDCCDHTLQELNVDEDKHQPIKIYCSYYGHDEFNMSDFEESYVGHWDDPADYAKETCEDCYGDSVEELPWFIKKNIDWSAVWDDMRVDYFEEYGHLFRFC